MDCSKKILTLILTSAFVLCLGCGEEDKDGAQVSTKLAINPVTQDEGNTSTTFSFKLQLNEVSTREVSVDFSTEEVSAGENIDYIPKSGKATIPAGDINTYIDIEIVTDEFKEADETFNIVLSNPVNTTLVTSTASGTIRNDDTFVDIPEDGYSTPESYTGYNLIWQDEFSGSAINSSFWTHETGAGGWGNQESQYYTNEAEILIFPMEI